MRMNSRWFVLVEELSTKIWKNDNNGPEPSKSWMSTVDYRVRVFEENVSMESP
jgi:hypothetical protein